MQGRLLPKFNGNYQAHPVGYWEEEFPLAAEIGLDVIEFILDYNDYNNNPLMTSKGIEEIKLICEKTNVNVVSICADYFMEAPFHDKSDKIVKQSILVLKSLLKSASQLSISDIVIPCVDNSSIKDKLARSKFVDIVKSIIPLVEAYKVNLSLETDLGPKDFENLLLQLDSNYITVNYDIGNSAAMGYDFNDELMAYGEKISDIHIKDRKKFGSSVILGSGDADITGFFNKLTQFNYKGPFIMQAYRDNEGLNIFKDQFNWLKANILNNAN